MKKVILVLSLLIMFALFVRSCANHVITDDTALTTDYQVEIETMTVRHAIGTEIKNLDPAFPLTFDEGNLFYNIFETLVKLDSNDIIVPSSAESWEISDDNLKYTFKIRDTMWSDGKKLTSTDFYNGFKYILESDTVSPFAYMLFPILNAKEYHEQTIDESELGIKVLDEETLEISLKTPRGDILEIFSLPYFAPMRSDQRFQIKIERESYPSASNGKYFIDKDSKDGFLILRKNPYHYEYESAKDKEIIIELITIEGSSSRISAFQTGVIDIATNLLPLETNHLMVNEIKYEFEGYGNFYYVLNSSKYPFNNKFLRNLVIQNLQREMLSESITGYEDLLSNNMLSSRINPNIYETIKPEIHNASLDSQIDINQDLGSIFREYGFIDKISILSSEEELDIKSATALKAILQKNLEIDVEVFISNKRNLTKEEILNYDIIQYQGLENFGSILDVLEFWIWNYPEISLDISENLKAEILQRNISSQDIEYLDLLINTGIQIEENDIFLPVYDRFTTNLIKSYIHELDISNQGFLLYDNIVIEK